MDDWEAKREATRRKAEAAMREVEEEMEAEAAKKPYAPPPPPPASREEELQGQLKKARFKLKSNEAFAAQALPIPAEQEKWRRAIDKARLEVARLEGELAALAAQAVAPPMHQPAFAGYAAPSHGVDQTAIAAPVLGHGPAVPFRPGPGAPPPPGPEAHDMAGATGFMPPLEDLADPIPFDQKPPELSVEQYASLCVERALNPGDDSAVAKRYQVLTEQALRSLDARWRQRFETEGELYRRWQQAFSQYEAWLKSRG